MDQFAQSREDDDLFGDDFEPVSAPTILEENATVIPAASQVHHNSKSTSHATGDTQKNEDARDHRPQGRGRGAHRGHERGRGRGRGRGGQNGQGNTGLAGSRYAPQVAQTPHALTQSNALQATAPEIPATAETVKPNPSGESSIAKDETSPGNSAVETPTQAESSIAQPTNQTSVDPTEEQPSQPAPVPVQVQPRITSVRGDRSLTGGPAKAKLTEAELSEKMAKMAILNAQKSEKFRRTEADSAAFLQKEAEMKKKRIEEQKNAREMDKERARNRERKLKAQGGREWDLEKTDADIVDGKSKGRSSEYVRGGHGGVIRGGGLGGSRFADDERVDALPSRGRGGFEIRGRGNRGRGGRGGKSTPVVPAPEDFPSLPAAPTKPSTDDAPVIKAAEEAIASPAVKAAGHDWAEEMATPVEEKKLEV